MAYTLDMEKEPVVGDSPEEVFAQIGLTLLITQDFEFMLERALKLVFADSEELTAEIVFKKDKRSLGRLMTDLRSRASITEDIERWMVDLLEDRNLFAHRLRDLKGFDCHTTKGRDVIWKFLGDYYQRLEKGILLFTAIQYQHADEIGFDSLLFRYSKHTDFHKEIARYYPHTGKITKKSNKAEKVTPRKQSD